MLSLMHLGGILMWPILIGGVIALAVFLNRFLHLHRARIRTDDFLKGIFNILARGNTAEAISICDDTPGPVAHLVRTALQRRDQSEAVLARAVDSAALAELARLERGFGLLATVARVAPILGVFGTVAGMIRTLLVIQRQSPLVQVGDLAAGIWQALLTTAAGLALALLAWIAYNLLAAKIQAIASDMERAAGDLLAFLAAPPPPAESPARPAAEDPP